MVMEGEKYFLKAMNCPHHHKIFKELNPSYKDLPIRLAEYGTCYRYEQSGELFGLMRVRSLNMNDAHIYLTEEQFEAEFYRALQRIKDNPRLFPLNQTGYRACRLKRFTAVIYFRIDEDCIIVVGLFTSGEDETALRDRPLN